MKIKGKKEATKEQTKKICDLSGRAVCEFTRRQPDHEGKSGNVTDLFNTICIEFKFSVYTGKLYDIFQYFSDLTAAFDPA